jgi:BarA-like signal transduction histidine kinase
LLDGAYIPLNESDAEVLSYLRKASGYAVLVAINMSAEPRALHFDLALQGIAATSAKTLLTTQPSLKEKASIAQISLEPYGVYIGAVK